MPTRARKEEKSGSIVWVGELGNALHLLSKSQTTLKSLETKLAEDAKKSKSKISKKDHDALLLKLKTLEKEKKTLETKHQQLSKEVSRLKEEEQKHNVILKLNKELQKHLEMKKREYEVSINEHARTKLANEDIQLKNNELYEKISDLRMELKKVRGVQTRRSSVRRERSRSGGSRRKGRSISQSIGSTRGKRSRSRSNKMRHSRTGSITRKHSRSHSRSRSVRRSLSYRRRSISCSIRKNPSRSRRRINRSASLPRAMRGRERIRSRSRSPRRNIVNSYADLNRRRRFSPVRRNLPYRRSPRR